MSQIIIGVVGAGTMGEGIAQVAAMSNHKVCLVDLNESVLSKAKSNHEKIISRLVEKGKISQSKSLEVLKNINYSSDFNTLKDSGLVIESIVEKL